MLKLDPKTVKKVMPAAAVGIEFGASVVVGALIGIWLDRWLGTRPYFFIFWLICGLIAGMRAFWRMAKKLKSDEQP